MGKNNRQRRAAKQRQRHQRARSADERRSGPSFDAASAVQALQQALIGAGKDHAAGDGFAAARATQALAGSGSPYGPRVVADVLEALMTHVLGGVSGVGWQPLDVLELTRRRLGTRHLAVVGAALVHHARTHPASRVHPLWWEQLRGLSRRDDDGLLAVGAAHGLGDLDTLTTAVELLGLLVMAPPLVPVLPAPGQYTGAAAEVSDEQARMLGRVRALLAKAESTEYTEEAEALSAKAQDLMARHSLHRLLVQHARQAVDPVVAVRIWLEAPYAAAKALLVQEVALANHSRAVWTEHLGCVTVMGRAPDLVALELLTTSLLVQATRAMVAERSTGRRTRSFRQSFLVAFAGRIGERLRGATADATNDVADTAHADLLPVLRAASVRVDEAVEAAFPGLVSRSVGVSDGLGWAAGRAAADLATLDVRGQVSAAPESRLADSA